MTTLRIASSRLGSAILFAEHEDFVSAYQAVHTVWKMVLTAWSFAFHVTIWGCAFKRVPNSETLNIFQYQSIIFLILKLCWPKMQMSRQAQGSAHSTIAVAAAAAPVVARKLSPKGLAALLFGLQRWHSWLCAQRLPSSTPIPHLSHIHTNHPH